MLYFDNKQKYCSERSHLLEIITQEVIFPLSFLIWVLLNIEKWHCSNI